MVDSNIRTIELDETKKGEYFIHLQTDLDNTIMLSAVWGFEEASVWLNKAQAEALVVNLEDLIGRLK